METPNPAYRGNEPYVFVCYARADDAVVYPEIGWLNEQGINIWYDADISVGKIWRRELAEAIQGASKVLYYISKASIQSENCSREIGYALDKEIEVIPVYLEDTELTPELDLVLNRVQALRCSTTRYRQHLLAALGQSDIEFWSARCPPSEAKTSDRADTGSATTLSPGAIIGGRYEVVEILGTGAMGCVYRVFDTLEEIDRALKVALQGSYSSESAKIRFRQEMLVMASMRHPNLPLVHDYGFGDTGDAYILMSCVEGEQLAATKSMQLRHIYHVFVQLLRAVSFIHQRGFLHRDLKPANIMLEKQTDLNSDPKVVLLDFGLMERIGVTSEFTIAGTPEYMPPEVIRGYPLDARADLYSLGITIFQLLAGRLPFSSTDRESLYRLHMKGRRPKPSTYNHDVPAALDELISRMISADPADRPADAEDVLRQLNTMTPIVHASDLKSRNAYLLPSSLIGRDESMSILKTCLEATRTQNGCSCLVFGNPGSGKSRLLQEFQLEAMVNGFTTVSVDARQEYRGAYQTLRILLRGLIPFSVELEAVPDPAQLLGIFLLDKAVPRIATNQGFQSPENERWSLVEEIWEWLSRISAARPTLLIIDDLQWCDESSLDVLVALAERVTDCRAIIIGSYRSTDPVNRSDSIRRWHHLSETRTIELSGFDRQQLQNLFQGLLGEHAINPDFIDQTLAVTEGNPFFAIEILRDAIDRGILTRPGGVWRLSSADFELPDSVGPLLQQRLSRIGDVAKSIASLIAVAGGKLSLEAITKLANHDETQTLAAVEELSSRQIATMQFNAVLLTHDRFREIQIDSLRKIERKSLHQRLAEYYESNTSSEPLERAALLGHHFARGEDRVRGLAYLEIAGRVAFHRQQFGVARDLLLDAESILEVAGRIAFEREALKLAHELLLESEAALESRNPNEDVRERLYDVKTMLGRIGVSDDYAMGADRCIWVYDQALARGILAPMTALQRWLPDPLPFLLLVLLRLPWRIFKEGRQAITKLKIDVQDALTALTYGAVCLGSDGLLTDARKLSSRIKGFQLTSKDLAGALRTVAEFIPDFHQGIPGSQMKRWETSRSTLLSAKGKLMDPYSRGNAVGIFYFGDAFVFAYEQHPDFHLAYERFSQFNEKHDNWILRNLAEVSAILYHSREGNVIASDAAEVRFLETIKRIGGRARQREWLVQLPMGLMDVQAGRFERATQRVESLLDERPCFYTEGYASLINAALYVSGGDNEKARTHAQLALRWATAPETRARIFEFQVLGTLCEIELSDIQLRAAANAAAQMKAWATESGHLTKWCFVEALRLDTLITLHIDPVKAEHQARKVLNDAADVGCRSQIAECHLTLADAIAIRDRADPEFASHRLLAAQLFGTLGNQYREKQTLASITNAVGKA